MTLLAFSCSSSEDDTNGENTNENGGITNPYSSYDFYISEGSRGVNNGGISKNFNALAGYERIAAFYEDDPLAFKIYGNNIYTYGSKKYRTLVGNSPNYYAGTNFSGYLNKNNNTLYSDLGGGSSTITDMIEQGSDVIFCTGYKFFEGGQSIDHAAAIGLTSKVFKNGTLLYNLKSPFNNWYYNSQGQVINNYYTLIYINNIVVKGSDIYVAGFCYDLHNSTRIHYGYWKNGIFNDIYNNIYTTSFSPKLIVAENGDTYIGFSQGGKTHLYKNNINVKTTDDLFFKDFGLLGNDIYSIGSFYDKTTNGYKLGVYKNGIMQGSANLNSTSSYESNNKMQIIDNKIFICGSGINGEANIAVYEFNIDSKSFIKVGTSKYQYDYDTKIIGEFQIVKK